MYCTTIKTRYAAKNRGKNIDCAGHWLYQPFSQSYLDQIYLNDLSKRSIFVADMQSFISSLVLLNFLVSNSNLNKINLIKVPLKKVIKVSIFEENENSLIYHNAERESNVLNEVLLYLLNHVGNVPKLNYNFRSIQLH